MDDYYFLPRNSLNNLARITPGIVAGKVADGSSPEDSDGNLDESEDLTKVPTIPMIARVAGLTLTTKQFEKTRGSVEEILKRYGGYLGQLQVSAPTAAGRTLTATLRIPAPQLEAAMAELKKLGRVKNESQGGEEVTQQYVDLEARLANGKHTEQRLTEILTQRTGKLQDVLKVELEIDRVRGEIEQMQAEKKGAHQTRCFCHSEYDDQEEYQAEAASHASLHRKPVPQCRSGWIQHSGGRFNQRWALFVFGRTKLTAVDDDSLLPRALGVEKISGIFKTETRRRGERRSPIKSAPGKPPLI